MNAAIRECLVTLNDRVSRHLRREPAHLVSRRQTVGLTPDPIQTSPYVYAEWKQCRPASIITSSREAQKYYSAACVPL